MECLHSYTEKVVEITNSKEYNYLRVDWCNYCGELVIHVQPDSHDLIQVSRFKPKGEPLSRLQKAIDGAREHGYTKPSMFFA